MAKKEVIVICGDKMVRVSADAFDLVVSAANQMRDDWMDYYRRDMRMPKKVVDAGAEALDKHSGITL